jgi:hypothetical protein
MPTMVWIARTDGSNEFTNHHWQEYTGLSHERTVGSAWQDCRPPRGPKKTPGKSHIVQGLGHQLIRLGFTVLYHSILDVVRDFLHDEALGAEDKILAKYIKPDLPIIDDMGMKHLPKRSGEYLFEIT